MYENEINKRAPCCANIKCLYAFYSPIALHNTRCIIIPKATFIISSVNSTELTLKPKDIYA